MFPEPAHPSGAGWRSILRGAAAPIGMAAGSPANAGGQPNWNAETALPRIWSS